MLVAVLVVAEQEQHDVVVPLALCGHQHIGRRVDSGVRAGRDKPGVLPGKLPIEVAGLAGRHVRLLDDDRVAQSVDDRRIANALGGVAHPVPRSVVRAGVELGIGVRHVVFGTGMRDVRALPAAGAERVALGDEVVGRVVVFMRVRIDEQVDELRIVLPGASFR